MLAPEDACVCGRSRGSAVHAPGAECGHAFDNGRKVYIIGSLRNPDVIAVAGFLRAEHYDVFDDWYSPGPNTDDFWQEYEKQRGRTFREALAGHHAQHAFALDKKHLDACDSVVLVLPAGKSGHLELGYAIGKGKRGYILMPGEPERFDLMYNFATKIFTSVDELVYHARTEGL